MEVFMEYPTYEEVEQANKVQLGRWLRFLPSPGQCAIGGDRDHFNRILEQEVAILDHITERFAQMGGWGPSTSKTIGWDKS